MNRIHKVLSIQLFSCNLLLCVGHAGDLSKHLQSVGVHHSNTSKSSACLERLNEKRCSGLKFNLSGLELGKIRGVVNLGSTGLLGLLPQDLGHLARNLGGAAKDNGSVTGLEDTRVLLNGDKCTEGLDGLEFTLLLNVDDVTRVDLLVLGNTLDGKTNRVTGSGRIEGLSVLFDGEDLLSLEARGDDTDDITGLEGSLFDGTADDLTNTLNVVDVGNGKTNRKVRESLRGDDEVVQALNKGETSDLFLGGSVGFPSLVPWAFIGLGNQVVSVESRVRNEGDLLGLETDELKHLNELLLDFVETFFGPVARVHLVDTNDELVNTEEVKKTGMLTSLSFLNTHLGVGLGDGSLKTTLLGGDEQQTDISGGGTGDHVLDVILVTGGIDNGVVVLLSEKLLGVALNGDTTLTFLLACIKVVSETEGGLSLLFSEVLKLLHLTLRDTSALEDQVTASGRLSGIDVTANNY
jgi:hypothetical protein